jgi:hypothetical protein
MPSLGEYLNRSVYLTIAWFLCVFFTLDLAYALLFDSSYLNTEQLIQVVVTAILSGIFSFKIHKVRADIKRERESKG